MSIDKKKERYRQDYITKEIKVIGNEDDIRALIQAIAETNRMFNIDIQRKDDDYPPRITIGKEADPEAVMYPRTAAYLKRLVDMLSGDVPKPLAEVNILGIRSERKDKITGVMENILWGSQLNRGNLSKASKINYMSIIKQLDIMIKNPALKTRFLESTDPEWVYIASLDTHQSRTMKEKDKKKLKKLLQADAASKDYPADMGKSYTQGYVAMLRTDKNIPSTMPTNIKQADWETLLKNFGLNKGALHQQYMRAPKTAGELFNFIFAYTVGQTMKMDGALVVPFAENRYPIESELIFGSGKKNDFGHMEVKGYRSLHKAVIVGKGPMRVKIGPGPGMAPNVGGLDLDSIPGFTM